MATHYQVLGIAAGATHDEIKRAYHRMARRHHPDIHSGAPATTVDAARERMAAINAARAVLGDPARRQAYDTHLGHLRSSTASPGNGQETGPPPEYPDWFEPDDEVAAADLEEDMAADTGRSPAQLVVFVPVGLAALAVVSFSLSVVTSSTGLFGLSLALVPLALVAFLIAPFVAMASRSRSRPIDD